MSYEPALGPMDFTDIVAHEGGETRRDALHCDVDPEGERGVRQRRHTGLGRRRQRERPRRAPGRAGLVPLLRDQCAAAGVPFFFKQWVGDADFREPE